MPIQIRLLGLRKERGITQAELATYLGISETSYRDRENGRIDFKLSEVKAISDYFKLPIDQIFLP